jgi:hypothetical protein
VNVVAVVIVYGVDVPSRPVTVTDVAVTAVTTPSILMVCTWGALMLMLVAVVRADDDTWMSTWSPTTRAEASTVVEPSVNVVAVVIVYGVDVPSRPVTVTDVAVTAVTTPPNLIGRFALILMLAAVPGVVEDT